MRNFQTIHHFPRGGQTVRQKKSQWRDKIEKKKKEQENENLWSQLLSWSYIYRSLGRRKLKKKRHSFFLQFDLIPHELCDSRHQLRAVEGFLVVALQDVGLVVVRLVVKKPSPMS